jgi:hypothetical protein
MIQLLIPRLHTRPSLNEEDLVSEPLADNLGHGCLTTYVQAVNTHRFSSDIHKLLLALWLEALTLKRSTHNREKLLGITG